MEKDKLDIGLLQRYLRGELSPQEMYALERRAQDDPSLMDIMLGMEMEHPETHKTNLDQLQERINSRINHSRKAPRWIVIQRWAIAASILVALSIGIFWFTQQEAEIQPTLASAPTKPGAQHHEQRSEPQPSNPAEEAPLAHPLPPVNEREDAVPKQAVPKSKRLASAKIASAHPPEATAEAAVTQSDSPLIDLPSLQSAPSLASRQRSVSVAPKALTNRTDRTEDSLSIAVQPITVPPNEITVAGYSKKSDVEISGQPEPENGWRAYHRYLKQGAKKASVRKGTVTLSFQINKEGIPTDIRIIETTDPALNEHAIQLVEQGSKWKDGQNGNHAVELKVTF